MTQTNMPRIWTVAASLCALAWTAGCSGPTEDVRVTLCKNLTHALQSATDEIEWTGNENTFKRPEYAITTLRFEVAGKAMQSACHYAHEALEDTAQNLANPLDAYATLPFAITMDGRALSDAELLELVNAEQRRQGRQVLDTLEKGAQDMADKVRASIGQ